MQEGSARKHAGIVRSRLSRSASLVRRPTPQHAHGSGDDGLLIQVQFSRDPARCRNVPRRSSLRLPVEELFERHPRDLVELAAHQCEPPISPRFDPVQPGELGDPGVATEIMDVECQRVKPERGDETQSPRVHPVVGGTQEPEVPFEQSEVRPVERYVIVLRAVVEPVDAPVVERVAAERSECRQMDVLRLLGQPVDPGGGRYFYVTFAVYRKTDAMAGPSTIVRQKSQGDDDHQRA